MFNKKVVSAVLCTFIATIAGIAGLAYAAAGFDVGRITQTARLISAMYFIDQNYVSDVDDLNLVSGAIDGMMKSLGDPHSVYMDKEQFHAMQSQNEGTFDGIGVVLALQGEDKKVVIINVMEGNPGESAGLKAGDEILAIDGKPVNELSFDQIPREIMGEKGTKVVLTIRREGEEDRDYEIVRDTIPYDTCIGKMLPDEDGIGYMRIVSFSGNTAEEFRNNLSELQEAGLKGLIIDLRRNPGGMLTTCVDIADQIVPKGEVVSVVYRSGKKEVYESSLEDKLCPIVVLIDENSASAAEILAGALKDRGTAVLVGTKSYGKGSVQVVARLADDDALKLTIAKYYTPSGVSIDGKGIEPDVLVELPAGDDAGVYTVDDTQLIKAIDVLKEKLSQQ